MTAPPSPSAGTDPREPADEMATLLAWLDSELRHDDLVVVIPQADPLRAWWQPSAGDRRLDVLFELIDGNDDPLSVPALVQVVRERLLRATPPRGLPHEIEQALARHLVALAGRIRNRGQAASHDAFVSYSHRDLQRVSAAVDWLRDAGVRVFQDVHEIGPGDSITARLTGAIHHARHALVMVSADYLQARWTSRELDVLVGRQRAGQLRLLPVLLDDVPLPQVLESVFTVDLRGFAGASDHEWAWPRLQRLLTPLGAPDE